MKTDRFPESFRACFTAAVLAALSLLSPGCGPDHDTAEGAQLVLPAGALGPTTTFEVRFDEPVARPAEVGKAAVDSPLLIQPALSGQFTWLSQRSGVFAPDEPLRLGTSYRLTLRGGLVNAAGQPLQARLRQTVRTPGFQVAAWHPHQQSSNASSRPEIQILFNAEVLAAAARPYVEFRSAKGRSVPADVRQGIVAERPERYMLENSPPLETWREQFLEQHPQVVPSAGAQEKAPLPATNEVVNFLVVSPRQPLPVGQGWKLVLSRGLPAQDGRLCLGRPLEIHLGDVTPFTVLEPEVQNYINSGKRVDLHFSKILAPKLTNTIEQWLEISPRPTNFAAVVEGSNLRLDGDFWLNHPYKLTLRAGLPADEPFVLEKAAQFQFSVPPVAPRLYFPETSTDQLASGNREFRLLVMNVERVRVRAKLLTTETLIHGLRGYASYVKPWEERDRHSEPFREIDYNLVPGRTIYEQELEGGHQVDQAETLILNWDDLLAGRKAAAVFLVAERVEPQVQRPPKLGTQALIQLTDLGLIWKTSHEQVSVFVFSHTTGQPVPEATVGLMSAENETLRQGRTDAQGLTSFPATDKAEWLMARLGEDLHAVKLDAHDIPLYGFDLPIQWRGEAPDHRRILFFSDRGVYRPGETVHLKAIAREWRGHELTVPEGLAGSLKCVDSRGRVFYETNVQFTATGSWNQSVPLPSGVRGFHQAQLTLASNDYNHNFLVQDFQPPAFEVALQSQPAFGPDDAIQIPVSARYYFGKTLSRAKVRWSLQAEAGSFTPEGFGEFSFAQAWIDGRGGRGPSSVSLQGEGLLSDRTNYVIRPDLPANPLAPLARTVELLVEVTDLNQQTLSRSAQFVRHSSDFYLGLKNLRRVVRAGEAVPVEVVAVSASGKPWSEPIKARLKLERVEWLSVPIESAGRTRRYRNETRFTNLVEREVVVAPARLRTGPFEEGMEGCSLEGVVPDTAGTYVVELRAQDSHGHGTIVSSSFYVAEKARLGWDYRNEVQIDLVPDRKSYQPGQTAEILVKTPISGQAWVTVEREQVFRSFLAQLSGNAPVVRVPLEAGDAPNVFLSVIPVRGSTESPLRFKTPEYRVGCCMLKVEDPRTRLSLEIVPESTNYLPGTEVRLKASIKDATGAPAPGAEVTLWAVDEGILSLTDFTAIDPHAFFFEQRSLAVSSGISLPGLMPEDPERLEFHNKGYLVGGGGRERLRKDFLPCAFWNATLTANAQGEVHAAFPAPDSLTRYRIMALAHAGSRQFGRGQAAFAVSKPLMIEPALNQFANVTDRLVARAVVFNQTDQAGEVLVTLELDGLAKAQGTTSLTNRLALAARGAAAVEFPVEFIKTGRSRWIWRARFTDPTAGPQARPQEASATFTDSVQSTIEVGHVAPLLSEIYLARVEAAQTNLLAKANPQLLEGEGLVTVTLANTRLGELGEAAGHLLHYPYGCVEQSSSSLIPWIVLRDSAAARFLHKTPQEIEQAIRTGVDRLLSMQTASGGLGYWPRDREPMVWGSAYGGMALALAARHNISVPKASLDKLLGYLSEELRGLATRDEGLSDRCLALYTLALAGRPEAAYHEVLFQRRDKLALEDRALLALAILESRGPTSMVEELLKVPGPGPAGSETTFGCPARQAALRLLAWTLYRPSDPTVDRLVADLLGDQKEARWATTQGNAWGLLALTEYAARVEARLQPSEGTLSWAGTNVAFRLAETPSVFEYAFAQTPDQRSQSLLITKTSTNRLYTQVKVQTRAKVAVQPRQDRGYSLQRSYARLDDENRLQDLSGLRVGDRVLVTLRLEVRQLARYLAIDDALPAVLEAINPEFKTQQTQPSPTALAGDARDEWSSDFRELRADRALFFGNQVWPGRYSIRYLARVRSAGQVTAPSAKVEEMYHPDRFGLAESIVIEAKPVE